MREYFGPQCKLYRTSRCQNLWYIVLLNTKHSSLFIRYISLTLVITVSILIYRYHDVHIAIYTGDLEADPEQILNRTEKAFNVKLQSNIEFVYLHRRKWVEASMYPYFTLLGQSLGSIWLGIEALNSLPPGDTTNSLIYFFYIITALYIVAFYKYFITNEKITIQNII